MDAIGEPYILRYAFELVRLKEHGGNDSVWHIPNRLGTDTWCQMRERGSEIMVVAMFDELPPRTCKRCKKHCDVTNLAALPLANSSVGYW